MPTADITNQSWHSLYLKWDITLGFVPAWPSRQPLISGSCHVQGHTCASPGVDSLCWGWEEDVSMGPYLLRFPRPACAPLQNWTRSHREGVMPFGTKWLSVEVSPWLLWPSPGSLMLCWWSLGSASILVTDEVSCSKPFKKGEGEEVWPESPQIIPKMDRECSLPGKGPVIVTSSILILPCGWDEACSLGQKQSLQGRAEMAMFWPWKADNSRT